MIGEKVIYVPSKEKGIVLKVYPPLGHKSL